MKLSNRRPLRYGHRALVLWASLAGFGAMGCSDSGDPTGSGGEGSVSFTTWGEDYVEQEIPPDPAGQSGFIDGWTVRYEHLVVNFANIVVADQAGVVAASMPGSKLFDNHVPDVKSIVDFDGLPAKAYANVSYDIVPIIKATEASGYRGTLTQLNDVDTNFFRSLRIPLVGGRDFTDADRKDTHPVAIISEAMANQFWPGQNAVGKRFHFFGEPQLREVVGVVRNTVVNAIGEDPQPLAYLPLTQDFAPAATMQVRTSGSPESVIAAVRSQVQSLDTNLALTNLNTIEELIDQGLWAPRVGAGLLAVFGALALLLAIVGVYGVLSYSVSQQTREIGIRMAMGARTASVLSLVVRQGMRLALVGLALGLVIAFAGMRLLSSLLFGVSAHDPATFAGVSLILATAAILGCYIPARRAAKINPISALRYE